MQTRLTEEMRQNARALEADSILRACVHCGFCTATCPTYQLLGDELDGPRGRIYLIKQVLEGNEVTLKTQEHLDRCLTCRNCETTCPSGVRYHNLLDIGRDIVEQKVKRPLPERMLREGLRQVVPRPAVFRALTQVGLVLRPFLPEQVRAKLPAETVKAKPRPPLRHKRRVLMLEGCAQPTLSPNTNAATARVLDRLGISVMPANEAGCCGAVDFHLNAQEKGLARARNNIDAWWPAIEAGAEAILQTASGCGAFVKEYGQMLKNDALYADKARQVSELAVDLVELLRKEPLEKLAIRGDKKLAFHCPCTLQHAQKLNGEVEKVLLRLGFTLTDVPDSHLCCGSAGTYALTHPDLARQLRDNKMNALESGKPEMIVTANIGCQTHLASAGRTSVRHWIEIVEQALERNNKMKTKVILSQQMASAIIAAGQEEAQKNNWSVSIAVADDGGHLLALSRMDDCAPIAAYISQEKARTAALGRRETKGYEEMVNNGRTAFVTAPLLTSLEGGVPVVVDGQIIGAVGVSGLTGAQDAQVAKAAAAVLAK
ncbi:glycolate oxidase iron-sulfur subunit [Escherichia coli]|nr:glycolate oxidase iron-sulfur subunit [Escherichia coli]